MSKHFVRSLFLGAVVAGMSACGGGVEPELEGDLDSVEQRVCQAGTEQNACQQWGQGGYSDPDCGTTRFRWKYWDCKQYKYTPPSGGTVQWYEWNCSAEKYMCGSSATVRPVPNPTLCTRNC
ncbi:hypothetical protein LXT21_02935 [Myxococcus sp. K38C18041901]|uniref:hypothetical protein n=1 Tax=Myxococcus guangdongensis TaxID=2906760 RepID=UPI0020A7F389|nr:hypothetical protein [Myxococcus guangdongensis]MCP3057727.1 hypothetical protein [Myxococcus guangdongensis]